MYQQSSDVISSRLSRGLSGSMASSILSSSSSHSTQKPLTSGHRDVTATLFGTKASKLHPNETDFTMTMSMIASSGNLDQHPLPGNRRDSISSPGNGRGNESPSLFLILLTLSCLTLLLIPNREMVSDTSNWFSSLLPSSGIKLCAAYVLGVITKLVLM